MRVGAAVAAVVLVLCGAVFGSASAQADEEVASQTAPAADPPSDMSSASMTINFTGSTLTLDSGSTTLQPHWGIERFERIVQRSGAVLDWFEPRSSVWSTAKAQWRILEDGRPTKYWVRIDNALFPLQGLCQIVRGPEEGFAPVGAEASPYSCPISRSARPAVTVELGPAVWSTVAGSLSAQDSVSLIFGRQSSQNARFWVSETLFRPGQRVASINPGETTFWKAEMRNGEGGEDDGTRTDFDYRIIDGGVTTNYYVQGFMHIHKTGTMFVDRYDCRIYSIAPPADGAAAEPAPYECSITPTEGGILSSNLAIDFTVRTRPV